MMPLMSLTDKWLALAGRDGASEEQLARAERELGVQFPDDYRSVMLRCDGGDADFGESWVALWSACDLPERNRSLKIAQFATGFTYFGSDRAGEGYAWDWRVTRHARYVVLPFISPDPDAAIPSGNTFEEFLAVLHSGIPFTGSRRAVEP
jgi:SMI1 / KNR4 family (SUKH-1)